MRDYKELQSKLVDLEDRATNIVFDEETHTYIYEGNFLQSVTQLLADKGISPNYSTVDKDLLAKASERGTQVHALIEKWIKTGEGEENAYLDHFIDFLLDEHYVVVGSEVRVANDKLGGTIDLILFNIDSKEYVIVDIKTTSVIHQYSVSWQLSLYDYLDKVRDYHKALALHFDKEGNLEPYNIDMQPKDIVVNLAENNELPTLTINPNELAQVEQAINLIEMYKAKIKENEELVNKFNEELIKSMEENSVKTFDNDRLKITYVAPVERETIDSKKLKSELPDIAKKYTKVSTTKASVRITLKGNKNEEE